MNNAFSLNIYLILSVFANHPAVKWTTYAVRAHTEENKLLNSFPVAQMVEHGTSNARIMGSIPRESKS